MGCPTPKVKEKGIIIKENIYGHLKRLKWILSFIEKGDIILEFGCGTGYMITIQLAILGYSVTGIDIDVESIDYGRDILKTLGLPPDILRSMDISSLDSTPDVVIASEVLEHLEKNEMRKSLQAIFHKLKPGGLFLVTVPNGYGFFELENFFWQNLGLGKLIRMIRMDRILLYTKGIFLGRRDVEEPFFSTLSESPHVQKFTLSTISETLTESGFEILCSAGSALFCGPFSNMMFTGFSPIMKWNNFLGGRFPRAASGFYIAAQKPGTA